jgi:hypothetical protein
VFVWCTKSLLENISIMSSNKYLVNKASNLHIRQSDCAGIQVILEYLHRSPHFIFVLSFCFSMHISTFCLYTYHQIISPYYPTIFSHLGLSSLFSNHLSTPDQSKHASFRKTPDSVHKLADTGPSHALYMCLHWLLGTEAICL